MSFDPGKFVDEALRFADSGGKGNGSTAEEAPQLIARPFVWRDPATFPRRQWVYGRHYIRKYLSTTVAPGGLGKTSLILVEALAMATGRNLLGIVPKQRCRVWYWCGEDPLEEIERRILAGCAHYGITQADLDGWLFVNSGREDKIIIATQTKSGTIITVPTVDALKTEIYAKQIDVLAIDPFVLSHQVSENDNMAVASVANSWAAIADASDAAVALAHHTRKTGGQEVGVDDGRGASALVAASRAVRALNPMSKEEAAKAGVDFHRYYFRVDEGGKANMSPPSERADWYHIRNVPLGNDSSPESHDGDQVGVVTPWGWPDPLAGITVNHLKAAQKEAAEGGPWREHPTAKNWVGIPIAKALKLNPEAKADRAKIAALLKTWTVTGMFVTVEKEDEHRHKKTYVEVGEPAN